MSPEDPGPPSPFLVNKKPDLSIGAIDAPGINPKASPNTQRHVIISTRYSKNPLYANVF